MRRRNTVAATKRKKVRKAQNRLGFAGALYLLGALAMAVLACMPTLKIDGKQLWVVDFWKPIVDIFKKNTDIFAVVVAGLYAILLLIAVFGFFGCFAKVGGLSKNMIKYVNGFDRNVDALEGMAKKFTASFTAIICLHLQIWLLQPAGVKVTLTMYAYITLGVGLLVHFLAGMIAGRASYFHREKDGNLTEEPREWSLWLYFLRNLVQIAAVAGMLWFFVPKATMGGTVGALLAKGNPFAGDMIKSLVPFVLEVLIMLCLFVLIRHAFGPTEFNIDGIFGKGMKNYRVFAFFVFLLAGGLFVTQLLWVKPLPMANAFVAGIAFVAFLFDCLVHSREKFEDDEPETNPDDELAPLMPEDMLDDEPVRKQNRKKANVKVEPIVPMPIEETAKTPMVCPYAQELQAKREPAPRKSHTRKSCPFAYSYPYPPYMYQQPTYIPVYQPVQTEKIEKEEKEAKIEQAEKFEIPQNTLPVEQYEAFDPTKRWDVKCPKCGKKLMVREMADYHRCPGCDKIFQIRIKQRINVEFNKE